ncbi:sialic acid synthase [Desulfocapsa sulfexigens DSM 10523]|uniref:Sialic acid synthase n=1 Tax=Desulfocapsa sulfexigens (strain DSM 10523 / SB164P1) TaxID=1167006 RepID=M1PRI8_DESSD|nr:N-acetylneuraminate synthase family protein [Desulfocapsa sulfexigens]AGF78966.1 sialic acid synthase [Desulfocapsa sulfexigens DSM 10523]
MVNNIYIDNCLIGPRAKTFIIAEVAQNHDGSLGTAHAYIDAVAKTGADAIKFQTHIASEESTLDEPFRVKFSFQDATRYAYWKRMEFTSEQWQGLAGHAKDAGLVFLSSPFSEKAVRILSSIGMPAWKVGSGEVFNKDIIRAMARNKAPILLSTGMSTFEEISSAVNIVTDLDLEFALFQCTSMYPVPLTKVGLNVIEELRDRYSCPIGYSDHTGSIYSGLAALAQSVDLLEVHVTLDKRSFGPDVPVSLTMEQLKQLVDARDAFKSIQENPVDKNLMASELMGMRGMFSKSVCVRKKLKKGTVLEESLLTVKKPGNGIKPSETHKLLGCALVRDVTPDRLLRWEDIE